MIKEPVKVEPHLQIIICYEGLDEEVFNKIATLVQKRYQKKLKSIVDGNEKMTEAIKKGIQLHRVTNIADYIKYVTKARRERRNRNFYS